MERGEKAKANGLLNPIVEGERARQGFDQSRRKISLAK